MQYSIFVYNKYNLFGVFCIKQFVRLLDDWYVFFQFNNKLSFYWFESHGFPWVRIFTINNRFRLDLG